MVSAARLDDLAKLHCVSLLDLLQGKLETMPPTFDI